MTDNFFRSTFEKHQIQNGKESRIKGRNDNGHVIMEGIIEGKRFSFDNSIPHKVFRKTPYPRRRGSSKGRSKGSSKARSKGSSKASSSSSSKGRGRSSRRRIKGGYRNNNSKRVLSLKSGKSLYKR